MFILGALSLPQTPLLMAKTNPHDALFKATLSHASEVEALVRGFLPAVISENLDFDTLQMENTAYISADLRAYFSDISYSCYWKTDADKPPAQITLLLEHKSYLPDNIHLQLLRYLTESYQHQYRSDNKVLRLVLPVVVYHGDQAWNVRDFADYFDLPDSALKRYLPLFSYELLDLSQVTEQTLFHLEYGFMLRSTFLLYKYRGDNETLLHFAGKIFNFAKQQGLADHLKLEAFLQLLHYIYKAYSLNQEEMQELRTNIMEEAGYLPGSLWDQAVQEGEAKGEARGKMEGEALEKLLTSLEDELELLSRMAAQDLPYDLMRKLTDVPEALLLAFRDGYTPETAEHLLDQVRHARTLSDLPIIRQHIRVALLNFGIADAVAQGYLEGR